MQAPKIVNTIVHACVDLEEERTVSNNLEEDDLDEQEVTKHINSKYNNFESCMFFCVCPMTY